MINSIQYFKFSIFLALDRQNGLPFDSLTNDRFLHRDRFFLSHAAKKFDGWLLRQGDTVMSFINFNGRWLCIRLH
jgi:hypothetical protein